MTQNKAANGDFVMFRKHNNQWGHSWDYTYGIITKTYHWEPNQHRHKKDWKLRCDICCTDGSTWKEVREDRIIILSKGK